MMLTGRQRGAGGWGRPRRVIAAFAPAVICIAAAAAVSGCGVSSSIDPVARAAALSTNASGYRVGLSMRITAPGLPTAITGTGAGSFDVPDHTGSLTLAIALGNSPQVVQALGSSTLRIQELIDGDTLYLKLPAGITSKLPSLDARPWLKLDLTNAASTAGSSGLSSLLGNPGSSNPSQLLQYLRGASGGSMTNLGGQVVGGIQTTHYRGEIDLDRVAASLPPASRASARQAITALEQATHLHQIPVDVWVDNQHLVRRMRVSFSETLPTGPALGTEITVDFLQYGPQAPPSLPPASQVSDASGLLGSGL